MNILLVYLFILTTAAGLRLVGVLRRVEVPYYNKKYLNYVNIFVRRADRSSEYTLSGYGSNKQPFGDNISVYYDFREELHNEYRPSFIQLNRTLCALVNDPLFIIKHIVKLPCPFPPGNYSIENLPFSIPNFNYEIPFRKGRMDVTVTITRGHTRELLGRGSLYGSLELRPDLNKWVPPQFAYSYKPNN